MKLLSYRAAGRADYGVLVDGGPGRGGIVALARRFGDRAPTLKAALSAGLLDEIRQLAARTTPDLALDQIAFDPVIPDPGKILCVGLNYLSHVKETGREPPRHPALFARYPESLVGHGGKLVRPRASSIFDWEGELALVVGTGGRAIPAKDALRHVAGYTCLMDGTLRDWQNHSSQFTAGKNFWHSGACGPWLATADEIPDPARLALTTRINGTVEQAAGIDDLVFDIPSLIEYVSTFLPLAPGDIISTGTPSGVGHFRTPPVYLRPGDTVEVEIAGIGVLRNTVVAE